MTETYLKDPAGLISLAPELEKLARADEAIASALAKGNPHRVYYALWWARLRGRLKQYARVVDQLLRQRRIFLMPLKGSPRLASLNGIGATVYGSSDRDVDGTYVKTHFFIVVFVPILPLAQFLVRDGDNPSQKSWLFMGRLPMAPSLRIWRSLFAAAVIASVALGGYQAVHDSAHHDIHFVNGLPKAVRVTGGDKTIDIPPGGGHRILNLPAGLQEVRIVSLEGKALEASKIKVTPGTNVQIWNILGAAPVTSESVFYTTNNVKPPEVAPKIYCGETHLELARADFLFMGAPASISMPKGQNITSRSRIYVETGGLEECLPAIASASKPGPGAERAATLGRALATIDEGTVGSVGRAMSLLRLAGKDAEVLPLLKGILSRHDGSIEHHRLYQETRRRLKQGDGLVAEYEARRAAHPDSPDAAYLHARLLPRLEIMEDVRQLLARFPDHLEINRLAAYALTRDLDFVGVLPVLEKIKLLNKNEWLGFADDHVAVLAALDRREDAGRIAAEAHAALEGESKFEMAARVSWLSGDPAQGAALVGAYPGVTQADKDNWSRRYWLAPGAARNPKDTVAVLEISSHYHPAAAIAEAATMTADEVSAIGPETLVLLEGEALRLANAGGIARIEEALTANGVPLEDLKAYLLEGRWSQALEDANLSILAATHAARARCPGVPAGERARLRDLAKRLDPVGGFARQALETWPIV